jgi:hypothetical protein
MSSAVVTAVVCFRTGAFDGDDGLFEETLRDEEDIEDAESGAAIVVGAAADKIL